MTVRTNPQPSVAEILDRDQRHVWHPYTQMRDHGADGGPLVIDRALGARLYERGGRSYIDANSSWWCATLGHGHPRIVEALREQAARLCHVSLAGIVHEPAALLAEALAAAAPAGLQHVFFSDDGSTAIEAALKLALQYWQRQGRAERKRFVTLDGAFHGETLGATALGGVPVFRRPFASVVMESLTVPTAIDGYEQAFSALAELLSTNSHEIAAVFLEPVLQGAAGMRIYDPRYVAAVRELTTKHDVLLVLDEVFTGYGRTGPMWAAELAGVAPDLLCVAKGFTAGTLPMAATLATPRLYEAFLGDRSQMFLHGHTFCGNPLGARVALEVLRVYADEAILAGARPKAERIASAFARFAGLPGVSTSRSLGMVGALELDVAQPGYLAESGWRVYREALRRGAYLRPLGNVVYIAPPLNIPDDDLDELLGIVEQSIVATAG